VVAIEAEVKSMEKKVSKIKAILLSKEIFDFSPEEHLKHGEVSVGHYQKYFLIILITSV
jgi:nesprin-2